MTRENAKTYLHIIQAFAEGKEIEAKNRDKDPSSWSVVNTPTFDFTTYDYRIKPQYTEEQLKEAWMNGEDVQYKKDNMWYKVPCSVSEYFWKQYEFRIFIRPEPTYRPFRTIEEFEKHAFIKLEHRGYTIDLGFKNLKFKNSVPGIFTIVSVGIHRYDVNDIYVNLIMEGQIRDFGFRTLFQSFVFDDGTPCGIMEE